jgi:hypothetical protein
LLGSTPARFAIRTDLVLAGVALVVMTPDLVWGLHTSDLPNYSITWTAEFRNAWAHGQIYPRWSPDSFEGLGAPTFYFYPPLAFFLTGAIHALGVEVSRSITLADLLLLFASGLAMDRWLRWRGTPSLLAAALYMALPYRLTDIYARGDLAEHAAFVWLPLIALAIEALPKRWAVPLLAASVAGLLLTHLPTAVLALVFVMAPLGAKRVLEDRRTLVPGLCAAVLGAALAAFFLLPALTLLGHIQSNLLWTEHFRTSNWFLWNWDRERWLEFSPFLTSCAGVVVLALRGGRWWFWMTAAAGLAAFGLLPILGLPGLSMVQFPWRAIGMVVFLGAAALAIGRPSSRVTLVAFCLLASGWISECSELVQNIVQKNAPQVEAVERTLPDAAEYLPRGLEAGVTDRQRVPQLQAYSAYPRASVLQVAKPGLYTMGRAAFPIWRLIHDGREVPYVGPLITFRGEPGEYRIERRWLWQEEVGAAISGMALLGLVLAALWAIRWRGPIPAGWAQAGAPSGS